jgi:hypothetical protein
MCVFFYLPLLFWFTTSEVLVGLMILMILTCILWHGTGIRFNDFNIYIVAWYRYQHPKAECYKRVEKLVQLVSIALQCFLYIFFIICIKYKRLRELASMRAIWTSHHLLEFLSHVTIIAMFTMIQMISPTAFLYD